MLSRAIARQIELGGDNLRRNIRVDADFVARNVPDEERLRLDSNGVPFLAKAMRQPSVQGATKGLFEMR